jgi:Domain of unknown function (DUF4424)
MKKFVFAIALAAVTATLATPSSANDSSASIGLGGLELTQNDAVSMDSEDLYLSREVVRVTYRFTNTSAKDVETLISFPLPAIPNGIDGHMGDQGYPNWKDDLNFKTMVDGQPANLTYFEDVSIIGRPDLKNTEVRLKELNWPVHFWQDYDFEQKYIAKLNGAEKAALVQSGLLRKNADSDYHFPNWQVQAHVTRTQIFPAGKTVTVEHSYKPVVGGSVGGMMERSSRKEAYFKEYAAAYCIDQTFIKGFDKRRYSRRKDKDGNEVGQFYVEHWLDYVLKSGANWKGPIKDFRLVVDKDKPSNLLSMCMTGVKKISPTRFEVRKTNFEPTQDINILIAEFFDPGAG